MTEGLDVTFLGFLFAVLVAEFHPAAEVLHCVPKPRNRHG